MCTSFLHKTCCANACAHPTNVVCPCVCAVWSQFLVQNLVDRAVLTKVCSKGTRYSSQLAGQILSESSCPVSGSMPRAFCLEWDTYNPVLLLGAATTSDPTRPRQLTAPLANRYDGPSFKTCRLSLDWCAHTPRSLVTASCKSLVHSIML